MIKFGSDLADLKEKFNIFSEGVMELPNHCVKDDEHTIRLSHEIIEIRQQKYLMYECMYEMKGHVNKLEKERNEPVPQAASFADVVRTPNLNSKVLQTPSSAERLDSLNIS